jgi:hypothetical protein
VKRIVVLLTVTVALLLVTPALAAGLSISPPSVEFDVPAEGSTEVEFFVYDFTGDLGISLENIPLTVEPTTVPVTAKEGGTRVVLTFYGDESLGSKIFEGKIRFLAMTGGMVAMGIKVRATVTNLVEGKTPVLATPGESPPPAPAPAASTPPAPSLPAPSLPAPETPATTPPAPSTPAQETPATTPPAPTPPLPPQPKTELPILLLAGIAAGTVIVITLIVVLARRPRY